MCGIIGQVNPKNKKIDQSEFDLMRDKLIHRGPDGMGTELLNADSVALGHRRLSIIDLSPTGKQPMCNETGDIWISFNGEIYNYKDLRQDLINKGHVFRSATDTEVLIHGYEQWGIKGLLTRLKGMFAFGIWDDNIKKLILARDRFGIKPLCYYHKSNTLVFASEIKSIKANRDLELTMHKPVIADFFTYSYIPTPHTIWKEVKKLPPAHYLIYDPDNDHLEINNYWKLRIGNNVISDKDAIERTNELLQQSVKEHFESDVPVGLLLSGGYDSSALLMYANRLGFNPMCFSLGFEGVARSEHQVAAQIAGIFGSEHQVSLLDDSEDLFDLMWKLFDYYDEPFAISSMKSYYYISKLASQKTKVVLAGDGGDEAFGGYGWYYSALAYYKNKGLKFRLKHLLYDKEKIYLDRYNSSMTGIKKADRSLNAISPDIQKQIQERGLWYFEKWLHYSDDKMKGYQYLDTNSFIPDHCLHRADISSMMHSLETRVPFLDHEIFEFTFNLNSNVYYKEGVKKFLLYQNLNKTLPDSILNLPKKGFSFHHKKNLLSPKNIAFIQNGLLRQNGIINQDFKDWDNITLDVFYHLLVLEIWFQKQN